MRSKTSEKQTASWPNKWISKKLSRLCEAAIQVDATNNVCTARTRINQDDAVCSNITGAVFSHTLKWSSLEQFLQWMSHCLSWMVYSELFLFSKNGGEILFSLQCIWARIVAGTMLLQCRISLHSCIRVTVRCLSISLWFSEEHIHVWKQGSQMYFFFWQEDLLLSCV